MANGLRWYYRLVLQTNCYLFRQKLKPELHVYLKFLLYRLCNELRVLQRPFNGQSCLFLQLHGFSSSDAWASSKIRWL